MWYDFFSSEDKKHEAIILLNLQKNINNKFSFFSLNDFMEVME